MKLSGWNDIGMAIIVKTFEADYCPDASLYLACISRPLSKAELFTAYVTFGWRRELHKRCPTFLGGQV